jgi:HPt (histidine-containing phosphotransfer) domain-containing protein
VNEPVFDHEAFAKRCVYDDELQEEIIRGSFPDIERHLAQVEAAFEKGNAEELERSAHALKGTSGTLSALRLQEKARAIELAAKSSALDSSTEANVRELRNDSQELRARLEELGYSLSSAPYE